MNKDVFLRCLFSAFLLLTGYYFGNLNGNGKLNAPLCATFAEKGMELEISAIYAVSSDQTILGMATAEDVAEMQKDARLKFHACPK